MSGLLICLCVMVQAQPAPAAVHLYPVDDTWRDHGFQAYVEKLRSAVENRNLSAFRRLVNDEVVVGPDKDDKGWPRFSSIWKLDDHRNSTVWSVLADLLSLGFVREHPSLYLSPYVAWRFPRELDMLTHLVVVRDNAELREGPSLGARPVASLSFEIVQRTGNVEGAEALVQWMPVRTLDGKSGFINARDLMSPLMPRAQFGLRRGRWSLIALETPVFDKRSGAPKP